MNFRLFRQKFSHMIDQPAAKRGIGICLLLVILGGAPFSFILGRSAKAEFCRLHDCTDESENDRGDIAGVAVNISVLTILIGGACMLIFAIILCRTNERDELNNPERSQYQRIS